MPHKVFRVILAQFVLIKSISQTTKQFLMEKQVKDILSQVHTSNKLVKVNGNEAIYYIDSPPKYIFPAFKALKEGNNRPIMIFSAPGAVGKTTFAKFFAHQKKGYYWDLSRIKLGLNTFIGTLADCFGHENLPNVLQWLSKGEVTFFFDGFDEAEMFSGWDGVVDFVSEIYKYVKKSSIPNIIFFSRTETVELITLALEDTQDEDSFSLYEIDYFDEEGAQKFIKMVLDENEDSNYRTHPLPFQEAVKKIFNTIGIGLSAKPTDIWTSPEVRSFVGYSPVLQTIGQYLVGQNYTEVINEFQSSNYYNGLNVITKFIDSLLTREQSKVVDGIKNNSQTQIDFDGWDQIYSPKTQLKCLVNYLANGCDLSSIIEIIECPLWLESAYLDAVTRFLPNHPFIRKGKFASPSFKDYALAVLLAEELTQESLNLVSNLSSSLSPLFSYYYHEETNGSCKGIIVGLIYDSLSSKLKYGDSQLLTVANAENDNNYVLQIAINSPDHGLSAISFKCIINNDFPLIFDKKLHNALILINSTIRLGRHSESIELKDVEVFAEKIIFDSKEVIANCFEDSEITMFSNDIEQNLNSLRVSKIGGGYFGVSWPGSNRYPWSQFNDGEISTYEFEKTDLMDKVYALKVILNPFRKHNKSVFAKQYEYIENVILKNNPIRRNVFEKMLSKNIIYKNTSRNIYELNDNQLESNGINWSDLKSLKVNDRLEEFLK